MKVAQHSVGFVYVLSNESMPGMVKIGQTKRLSEDRAGELRRTGVPLPFKVEYRALTSWPKQVEAAVHASLARFRVSRDREFFQVSPEVAAEAVKLALLKVAGLGAWSSCDEQERIKTKDRLALTAEANDFFVVLARSSLFAQETRPVDIWQAHADGDVLELMGTASDADVAGFSDNDLGGATDPAPFLDRGQTAPNEMLVLRERLVSGDRLLWLRDLRDGVHCGLAIFDIVDFCQVVGRAWVTDENQGRRKLMNEPAGEVPAGVVNGVRLALNLPMTRTWAPRAREFGDSGDGTVSGVRPPEYWLEQLAGRASRRARPAGDARPGRGLG